MASYLKYFPIYYKNYQLIFYPGLFEKRKTHPQNRPEANHVRMSESANRISDIREWSCKCQGEQKWSTLTGRADGSFGVSAAIHTKTHATEANFA